MKIKEIKTVIKKFITEVDKLVIGGDKSLEYKILTVTHLNQILRLNNFPGIGNDAFKYYFINKPPLHPYNLNCISIPSLDIHPDGIYSPEQLEWGITRFFIDSLLYFGNITTGYSELRNKSLNDLEIFFNSKRYNTEEMKKRANISGFQIINDDDRYLIGELACKAYQLHNGQSVTMVESKLINAYRHLQPKKTITVKSLLNYILESKNDKQDQMVLEFGTEEIVNDEIINEAGLTEKMHNIAKRFVEAREKALANTKIYLSLADEIDVYVATSMRNRDDFREMAKVCSYIFNHPSLQLYNIRYFDPTLSASVGHEDKGLLECLMVKLSKVLIYFSGEKDSFGKDCEAAMAMSQGKPVIIVCPEGEKGKDRMLFFRDTHPLSRSIDFTTGVASGAIITNNISNVIELLKRIFSNTMQYKFENDGNGYYRIRELLTNSAIRLQTNDQMILNTQWELLGKNQ